MSEEAKRIERVIAAVRRDILANNEVAYSFLKNVKLTAEKINPAELFARMAEFENEPASDEQIIKTLSETKTMNKEAIISDCGKYRYLLIRVWDRSLPLIGYIGLNPSTADENVNDATINRLIAFTKSFGYGGFYVGNLVPIRTKSPKVLKQALSEYSQQELSSMFQENLAYLIVMRSRVSFFVFCWGANDFWEIIAAKKFVENKFDKNCMCFGLTKKGHPKHPLYLKGTTQLVNYN